MERQEIGVAFNRLFSRSLIKIKLGMIKMILAEAKKIVKTRYGKFAETGGTKDSC